MVVVVVVRPQRAIISRSHDGGKGLRKGVEVGCGRRRALFQNKGNAAPIMAFH